MLIRVHKMLKKCVALDLDSKEFIIYMAQTESIVSIDSSQFPFWKSIPWKFHSVIRISIFHSRHSYALRVAKQLIHVFHFT